MLRLGIALVVLSQALVTPAQAAPSGAPTSRQGSASGRRSPEASCQQFVQGFYDRYLKQMQGTHDGTPSDLELKHRPAFFSRELRQRLAEDLAAASRNKDEIVGLDFDPFLNAQDVADRYVARKVVRAGPRYLVEVHAITDGKRTPAPVVIPELVRSGSGWTFVNFHYRSPEKPSGKSDLLSILSQLRADRKKNRR